MSAGNEVKVLTTGILKGAFDRIAARFHADTGHKVTMSWGPGTSAQASPVRVRSGEAIDVLIMVDTSMDDLAASGHFNPLQRTDVAVSKLPDEVQKASVVSAAVSAKAVNIDAARQFVAFLSTPFATGAIRASGLDLPDARH